MTEDLKPESPEADDEFQRVLRNLVNWLPKPHQSDKPSVEKHCYD